MNPDFHAQVNAIWRQQFDIPADQLDQPGTSVIPEPDTYHDDWLGLWPVGARIVIESPPALLDDLRRVAADHPADHQLTVADLQAGLGSRVARTESMPVYMLDAATFTRIMPDDRYTVRALTPADQVAFDVFQDHCTPDERAESDISIEQAGAFGVLDGDRIVAGASTYLWRGFVDVGVLTDPAYRHQGLGAAVVSAVCAHIIQTGAGIMVYRHVSTNRGSQGVAEKVGFSRFMMVESVQVGNGA